MADLTEKLMTVVEPALKAAVEQVAKEEQRSAGAVLRQALRAYQPVRDALATDGSRT